MVRDGYRDIVYYRFRLNRSAAGTVRIVNRRGRVVRGFLFSGIEKGTVRWNGRNKYGRKVPTGYYWFKVKAHYQGYRASGGRLAVRVRTGFRYTTHRVSTLGQRGSGRTRAASRAGSEIRGESTASVTRRRPACGVHARLPAAGVRESRGLPVRVEDVERDQLDVEGHVA